MVMRLIRVGEDAEKDPTWRVMGLGKYSHKYLKWRILTIRRIVDLIITLVTMPHDPPSNPETPLIEPLQICFDKGAL